jgi:(2Fe-2S) ferredoxin
MELKGVHTHLLLCNGKSCVRAGADAVTTAIREEIKEQGLQTQVHTTKTLCNGRCVDSCTVVEYPRGLWYKKMTPELGRDLVRGLVNGNRSVESMTYTFDGKVFAAYREPDS